jgi:glutamyl-tRNA reductase
VTSSLDSLVLGETQIFGQVKTAYKLAHQNECTDKILNQLMHQAFAVTKKIRTETGIGLGSTSVSSIAVELLEESICTRNLPTVVVLGAGEIGKTTAKTFLERELGQLVLINRTHDSAKQIAKNVNVSIAKWSELDHWLLKADALITCCSSTKPVITAEQIKKIMQTRHDHRLNIVDLGIPRNVEPHTATLDKVELYNIDDLQNIAQRNHAARKNESKLAEDIIAQETAYTQREIFNPTAGPTIAELNKKCETIRAREVKKMLEQMEGISTEQQMLIERCTTSIINKVLHDPINSLRQNTDELCQSQVINLVRQTFQLETEKD